MWDISLFNQVMFSKMQQLSAFTRGCRTFIAIYVTYLGDDMLVGWGRLHLIHSFFALAHLKSVSVMEKRGFTSSICAVSRCRACMQGAAAILRRADAWRELLQSKFPFFVCEDNLQLGNRAFYVPPSPVIGCHWSCVRGGETSSWLFSWFPRPFFSLSPSPPQPHSHSTWRPNRHAVRLCLKILSTLCFLRHCFGRHPWMSRRRRRRSSGRRRVWGASFDSSAHLAATIQ